MFDYAPIVFAALVVLIAVVILFQGGPLMPDVPYWASAGAFAVALALLLDTPV